MVSAIITTYGREFNQIFRSINSVFQQTYSSMEIVLVDDNNPDSDCRKNISEAVKNYPNIVYVPLEKNSGAQVARNRGIKAAHGEFVAFLDDDDEWLPSKIEEQIALVEEGVGLVYCKGFIVIEETLEQKDYVTTSNFKTEVSYKDLLYADYIGTTTQALVPKHVFSVVGDFDTDQPARQDYEMWLRISSAFRCIGVDKPLFKHYMHRGVQISKDPNKAIKGLTNILNKYSEDYKKNPLAKLHLLTLIIKRNISVGCYIEAVKNSLRAIVPLFSAVLFQRRELKSVIAEHKNK